MSSAAPSETPLELIQIRLVVAPQYHGWRLDRYLAARIPRLSRNRVQQMIRSQEALGARPRRPANRVRAFEEVVLLRPAPHEPDVPRSFVILHQDDAMLAIDKPAGLPVHATARFHRNTLTALLREQFPESPPAIAHRLDRETSGLMLLGRTRAAMASLKRLFRQRQVQKSYLAVVHGQTPGEGLIDLPLGPDLVSGIRIKMAVTPGGLPSRTRYRTLEHRGGFSLVEARPETGRQHQIRAHLDAIGHPVVGDKLYGQPPTTWLEYIEAGLTEGLRARLLHHRQALHAAAAAFPHPETGVPTVLHCPLAEDLRLLWENI